MDDMTKSQPRMEEVTPPNEDEQRVGEELHRRIEAFQRRQEDAGRRPEDEQRLREDEKRLCEDIKRHIEELKRRTENDIRRREDKKRQRENEKRQRENEKRRREAAEALIAPQNLQQYLESCHSLHLSMEVVTDQPSIVQEETMTPMGRIFPRQIIPWDGFALRQEEIWNDLSASNLFSQPGFPSKSQLEYVESNLHPARTDYGLQTLQYDVVETAVRILMKRALTDPLLRSSLRLHGELSFGNDTNPETASDHVYFHAEQMPLARDNTDTTTKVLLPASRAYRKARGKGNRATQFCMYKTSDRRNVLAVLYIAPHKLRFDEITTALETELQPEHDVVNNDCQGSTCVARRLVAAAVTQLFSYMVGKGIQFGYICTGPAYIFLHIPDDPSTAYFSLSVPNQDVKGDENKLYRSAVAQVFAFLLQALRAEAPPLAWHDAAETLGTWAFEYEDVLRHIVKSGRSREEQHTSACKAHRSKGFDRSPIRTRSRCRQLDPPIEQLEGDDGKRPYLAPSPPRCHGKASQSVDTSSDSGKLDQGQHRVFHQESNPTQKPTIKSQPFCTQSCLLGLAYGESMDKTCPNASYHGQTHLDRLEFLRLVRHQLATDRGIDAYCAPLHKSGARGSLFKVRLASHGYTLVAKGVESVDIAHLQHENKVYSRLEDIQGKYIPVCLGTIDLVLPYYYDSGVYVQFLFLGWAGQPLYNCVEPALKDDFTNAVAAAFKAIHKLGVLHTDAEVRNILFNTTSRELMVVDFERAKFHSPKGGRGELQKGKMDDFERELSDAIYRTSGLWA